MRQRLFTAIFIFIAIAVLFSACSSGSSSSTSTPAATTALDGATLIQERCSRCHPLSRVTTARHTATEWQTIVDQMIRRGASLNANEETVVVEYLAATYGK
jgi:ABC-type Fe3+-hydroxamate transport system substrate-binding protein